MALGDGGASAQQNFSGVDWDNHVSVSAFINSMLHLKERENWEFERQCDLNIAWYRGHQMLLWNRDTKRLQTKPNKNRRVRMIANNIAPLVDAWVSKIGLDRIRYVVRPATSDLDDHDVAKLGSDVLKYYQNFLGFQARIVNPLDKWAALCGEAFCKVCWDPGAGREIDLDEAELAALPKKVANRLRKEALTEGDLAVTPVPVFNIFWGPCGVDFEDADWVLETYDRSIAYVAARYPDFDIDKIKGAASKKSVGKIWRHADTSSFGQRSLIDNPEVVATNVLWVRRNPGFPSLTNGYHCVQVGDELVTEGEIPYRHKQIPIVRMVNVDVPGQPRGRSPVDDLIPLQMDLNRNVSQQVENRELMAFPVWLARHGAIQNHAQWIGRPGGIREYRGEKPELIPGAPMPDQVNAQLAITQRMMQDVMGIRDVSQAKNPSGVRSGRAILALREADDERLGPYAERRREFFSRIGQFMLQTLSEYVTEERMIRILGDEDESRVLSFRGDMLTGESRTPGANYFDVSVETAGLSQSPSARMENVALLAQQGFMNPADPADRRIVMETMVGNDPRYGVDKTQRDREIQRRRNELMLMGQYESPKHYENLEVLQEEFNEWRKRFLSRPGDNRFAQIEPLANQYEVEIYYLMASKQRMLEQIVQAANPPQQGQQMELPYGGENEQPEKQELSESERLTENTAQ